VGLVLALVRLRRDDHARALVVMLVVCLLLSFGRTTFHGLVDVIPGHADIFFRRFMMGVQLCALLLAGWGASWCAAALWRLVERLRRPGLRRAQTALALGGAVAVLTPAWLQLGSYDRDNSTWVSYQQRADAAQGADLNQLIARILADGGGRTYAGSATNWGANFAVGAVAVFKYLESRDVDEVGYTLRTASLMTDPEYYFDQYDPGDYALFGIRYLILPAGSSPPVPATLAAISGAYSLWTVPEGGYVHVGRIVGQLTANRTDLAVRSLPLLESGLPQEGDYLRVDFAHRQAPPPPLPSLLQPAGGSVGPERDDLDHGEVTATVHLRQPGVVVLSASFDPGWTVSVDGHRQATEMVDPALVATSVPAGTHRVVFRFRGYRDYPQLFALGLLALIGVAVATSRSLQLPARARRWAGRARRSHPGGSPTPPARRTDGRSPSSPSG
jgi:hypothetical protein